jgi:glucokinase
MTNAYHIAVDLGGTNIRAARFSEAEEKIEAQVRVPTEGQRGAPAVLDTILQSIRQVMPEDPALVRGIGIGVPGPIDPFRGEVIFLTNLPGWQNFPLRDALAKHLALPIHVTNDANLGGLGEWKFGAGRGTQNMIYFTISTGIGSGIICGGRMILGERGFAAELGHLIVKPDGPMCNCGKKGHLEAMASGLSIARQAREQLAAGAPSLLREWTQGDDSKVTAALISKAAHAGDAFSLQLFRDAGRYIGMAVADMLVTLNPTVIVFGGGVSNTGDILFTPIRESIEEFAVNTSYTQNLRLVPAMLGDDSGLFGGFALSRDPGLAAG